MARNVGFVSSLKTLQQRHFAFVMWCGKKRNTCIIIGGLNVGNFIQKSPIAKVYSSPIFHLVRYVLFVNIMYCIIMGLTECFNRVFDYSISGFLSQTDYSLFVMYMYVCLFSFVSTLPCPHWSLIASCFCGRMWPRSYLCSLLSHYWWFKLLLIFSESGYPGSITC